MCKNKEEPLGKRKALLVVSGYELRNKFSAHYTTIGYEVSAFSRFDFGCIDWMHQSYDLVVVVYAGEDPAPVDLDLIDEVSSPHYLFLKENFVDAHQPP